MAIRITKSGKDDKQMAGACEQCGCEVECMKHDATPCQRGQQQEQAYFVCCPSCRHQHLYVKEKQP